MFYLSQHHIKVSNLGWNYYSHKLGFELVLCWGAFNADVIAGSPDDVGGFVVGVNSLGTIV